MMGMHSRGRLCHTSPIDGECTAGGAFNKLYSFLGNNVSFVSCSVVPLKAGLCSEFQPPGTCPSARVARLRAVPGYFHPPLAGLVPECFSTMRMDTPKTKQV